MYYTTSFSFFWFSIIRYMSWGSLVNDRLRGNFGPFVIASFFLSFSKKGNSGIIYLFSASHSWRCKNIAAGGKSEYYYYNIYYFPFCCFGFTR